MEWGIRQTAMFSHTITRIFSDELAEKYGGTDRAVRISDVPVISELVGFNDDYPLYLCIKGKTYAYTSSKLTEEEYYGTALKLLDSFYAKYAQQ